MAHLRNVNSYIVDFFQTLNTQKKRDFLSEKRDFLSEKRESGMTLKKREFTPESGSVDTYVLLALTCFISANYRPC